MCILCRKEGIVVAEKFITKFALMLSFEDITTQGKGRRKRIIVKFIR